MSLDLIAFLHAVNAVTPLGLAALLGVVILLMTHKRGPIRKIQDNHLAHVQAALERIADNSDKNLEALHEIGKDISYVKGRIS